MHLDIGKRFLLLLKRFRIKKREDRRKFLLISVTLRKTRIEMLHDLISEIPLIPTNVIAFCSETTSNNLCSYCFYIQI